MMHLLAALLVLQGSADTIAIRGGRMLDVGTGRYEEGVTLLIANGHILARGHDLRIPPGVSVIDAAASTILPGLIDAHVHLTIAGAPRENAGRTLRAGFTTVADLGSANEAGVRLRRWIEEDSVQGPTMITAGSWIGGKGGVCEFGGATIRGAAEATTRAERDLAAGADLLKVCVSGWINDAAAFPDSIELSRPEIDAVMMAAHAAGKPVAAHATSRAAVRRSLDSGIRFFAHTPIVDESDAESLARSGACVATTMTTLLQADSSAALRASFQRLRKAGVKFILGTDAGVLPHGRNADEAVTLASLGMPPLEILRAATTLSAECLGLPRYGGLGVGDVADLLVVSGDPLQDISTLKTPILVIRRGRKVSP
jgi:imidazolonepropionase-like amidohydrolase